MQPGLHKIYTQVLQFCLTRTLLDHIYDYSLIQQTFISSVGNELCKLLQVCIILNRRYSVVVTNPPYLGSGRYSSKLSEYVSLYYANEKADLSMVVYKKILSEMTELMGYCGLITTNSWMTLKSFAKIRKYMINNASIESIVEYGTELFDGKIGHNPIVSWINRNIALKKKFTGIDLTEYCYSRRDEKKKEFFNESNRHYISPEVLLIIPGMPINFSCDNAILKLFNNKKIGDNYELSNCIQPGDSEKYVRMWQEIDAKKINKKWYLLSKGGAYRKWYGNLEYIINYENNGEELLKCEKATLRGQENYFQSGFVWTRVTSSNTSFRFIENDKLVTDAGPIIYSNKLELLGFLNSKIGSKLLKVLNPTLNCQVGNVSSMPDIEIEDIGKLVSENIEIARKDWNSRETSFEFKTHPFIDIFKVNSEYSLKQIYHKWNLECKERFNRLKNNENRITKIICERYNVNYTDDLMVSDKEIQASTHLADRKQDTVSLISYIVGLIFGRYSLENGLCCTSSEIHFEDYTQIIPDQDNIIPITTEEYFGDDIVGRVFDAIRIIFGEKNYKSNLDFIDQSIGMKGDTLNERIRNYFITQFYSDHKKMYQGIPIYWMFSSGKNNGFKALIYVHRYNKDIVGLVRSDYLHKTQEAIEKSLKNCEFIISTSASAVDRARTTRYRDLYIKQLNEIRTYYQALSHIALQRIELDLDDGVKANYAKFQGVEISNEGTKKQTIDLLAKI